MRAAAPEWLRSRAIGLTISIAFAAVLAVPFFWRLPEEEFHGDESHWITSGQQAVALLAAGRLGDAQWREEFYFYSQPQVGKVLIGLALAGAGLAGPTPIYDYDWQLRPAENRAIGRVPVPEAVAAGRLVGAVSGWVACLALWGLGAALGSPLGGAAGALLLASHPLWLANARRAGLDAPALTLGLLAALLVVLVARRRLSPPWIVFAGVLAGLAAGTKYVAVLSLPVALVPFVAAVVGHNRQHRVRLLLTSVAAVALAALVFWVTNPALYADPVAGLRTSYDFLTQQAEDMRSRSPVFTSPALVAAEVIDRAVWPIAFPTIVDVTLPEPLTPGSYGTPVVALGALFAIFALSVQRFPAGQRPAVVGAATWTATVYGVLVWSVPIWWERWHLPLVPPLCLLAGAGLATLARGSVALTVLPAGAQLVAAMAMGPSYLGRGFGALIGTPLGVLAHLLLVPLCAALLVHFSAGGNRFADWRVRWQWQTGARAARAAGRQTVHYASGSSARGVSPRGPTSPATSAPRGSSSTPPAT